MRMAPAVRATAAHNRGRAEIAAVERRRETQRNQMLRLRIRQTAKQNAMQALNNAVAASSPRRERVQRCNRKRPSALPLPPRVSSALRKRIHKRRLPHASHLPPACEARFRAPGCCLIAGVILGSHRDVGRQLSSEILVAASFVYRTISATRPRRDRRPLAARSGVIRASERRPSGSTRLRTSSITQTTSVCSGSCQSRARGCSGCATSKCDDGGLLFFGGAYLSVAIR